MQRILFGFVKKVILADSIAPVVDSVFASHTPNALDVGVAIFGFGLQIYFDFSAYSDIAIGSARLFGFRFPENFNWPYAARSPQDFWNRWHMTLSRWIRDYVFTPLAFASRHKPKWTNVWLLVAMAAVGLWHGAQWTFVVWGIWHGLLLVANQTVLKRFFERASASRMRGLLAMIVTFSLVMAGWLLFRAESLAQVADYLRALATMRGGIRPSTVRVNGILLILLYFAGLVVMQMTRGTFAVLAVRPAPARVLRALRPLGYVLLIVAVIVLDQEAKQFVYFQF